MRSKLRKIIHAFIRPEYPQLYASVSMWIATPLLGIGTLVYIQQAIEKPAHDMFPIAMSAFGVTAGLSGICFSMTKSYENPYTPKYAGEKFLHSSILLIQTLLVLYVRDAGEEIVGEITWLKMWSNPGLVIKVFCNPVLALVSTTAALTWYFGFEEINKFLWKAWEERIKAINAQKDARISPGIETTPSNSVPLKPDLPTQTDPQE